MRALGCIEAAGRYMETKQLPREAQRNWSWSIRMFPQFFDEFVADLFAQYVLKEDTLASLVSD